MAHCFSCPRVYVKKRFQKLTGRLGPAGENILGYTNFFLLFFFLKVTKKLLKKSCFIPSYTDKKVLTDVEEINGRFDLAFYYYLVSY